LLAVQIRSGLVETTHEGAFAAVNSALELVAHAGDIDLPFFLRSSAKPFQAFVAQELGADLGPVELALACASHDGFPAHVAIVDAMLAKAGLDESHLQCPPLWPLSLKARDLLVGRGATAPRRIWHDCSGKHAGWLRACVAAGLPTDSYLNPDHPIQVRVAALVSELGEYPVEPRGIDGCGAPVLRTTVRAMARMYASLAIEERFEEVFSAMHRYPSLVSGGGNGDAAIATALDGAAKRGARGCIGVGIRNQLGVAAKSFDGNDSVAALAAASGLHQLLNLSETVSLSLAVASSVTVFGGGEEVGALESRLELSPL
jgi:L-asparaginase II